MTQQTKLAPSFEITKHNKTKCHNESCNGECLLCTSFVCDKCKLANDSLTTHCPGVESYSEHSKQVSEGKIDYRGGLWIEGLKSRAQYTSTQEVGLFEMAYTHFLMEATTNKELLKDLFDESIEVIHEWVLRKGDDYDGGKANESQIK